MNTFANTLAASLAAAFAVPSAHAGILGFGTNTNPFAMTSTDQPVPLRSGGATTVAFRTRAANALVVVTYNAECSATSNALGTPVAVRLAIDGAAVQPFADLCTAVVPGAEVYIAASRRWVVRVPNAGLHTVEVFATFVGTGEGRLDDSSIVIDD